MKRIQCNIMTRTVGYYANTDNMNPSKREEVSNRKLFDVNNKKKNYPKWKKDLTLDYVNV